MYMKEFGYGSLLITVMTPQWIDSTQREQNKISKVVTLPRDFYKETDSAVSE